MISEAKAFWDAIKGKVKSLIRKETENAMRLQRYDVTTAPNGTVMGVRQPFGNNEIFLPYSKEVASATVGDTVLVAWWGSMSNAKVYYFADGFSGAAKTSDLANDVPFMSMGLGTQIPQNSNLNDYTTPGVYFVASAAEAATMSNGPLTTAAYRLEVTYINNTGRYRQTAYVMGGSSLSYTRTYSGSSWGGWQSTSPLSFSDVTVSSKTLYHCSGTINGFPAFKVSSDKKFLWISGKPYISSYSRSGANPGISFQTNLTPPSTVSRVVGIRGEGTDGLYPESVTLYIDTTGAASLTTSETFSNASHSNRLIFIIPSCIIPI